MANEAKIGRIKWLDAGKRSGVITREDGESDVYFDFDDVEVGVPQTDKTVQFVEGPSLLGVGSVAKRIVVVSDAARSARRNL